MEEENNTNIEGKLLKEAIWNIEDKLNVVLKSITEHEKELIALRRLTRQCQQRLVCLEKQKEGKEGVH